MEHLSPLREHRAAARCEGTDVRLATAEDFAFIDRVFNDPAVRTLADAPAFEAAKGIQGASFAVVGEEGAFLAIAIEPSRYLVHTGILPEFRGERAVLAAQQALRIAFTQTDALELETLTPACIPQARLFARQMGFRHRFSRPNLWPNNGELLSVGFHSMTILDWALSGACKREGEAFHERLHGEYGVDAHPTDTAHDAIVGAAVEMVRAGRPDKGVAFYNYWARLAGYRPISIVSRDPLRIDIHQCVLRVEGPDFFMEAPHA